MGLFDFIGDMETASKLSNKYGLGAANAYLKLREMQDSIAETQTQKEEIHYVNQNKSDSSDELHNAIQKLRFQFSNYLRKTDVVYSDEDKKYLYGIIDQCAFIYDASSANELIDEWNDFCFNKELIYYISHEIKTLEGRIVNFLYKDSDSNFDEIKKRDLQNQFQNIYNSSKYEEFLYYYEELKTYLLDVYDLKLEKKVLNPIENKINSIFSEWGQDRNKNNEYEVITQYRPSNINDEKIKNDFYKKHNLIIYKNILRESFESNIQQNGEDIYLLNRFNECHRENNLFSCEYYGTDVYDIRIKFVDDTYKHIEKASCTCPYHQKYEKNCKHIYAVLKKIYTDTNYQKMIQIIEENIPKVDALISDVDISDKNIKRFIDYYNSIKNYYHQNNNEEFTIYCNCYGVLDIKSKLERIRDGKSAKEVELEDKLIKPIKRKNGPLVMDL